MNRTFESIEIVRNIRECPLCHGTIDRYGQILQCRSNPAHVGDTRTGIITDHTDPNKEK